MPAMAPVPSVGEGLAVSELTAAGAVIWLVAKVVVVAVDVAAKNVAVDTVLEAMALLATPSAVRFTYAWQSGFGWASGQLLAWQRLSSCGVGLGLIAMGGAQRTLYWPLSCVSRV